MCWGRRGLECSGTADEGDIADCEGGREVSGRGSLLILGQFADARVWDLLQEQVRDVPDFLVPVVGEQAWDEDAEDPFGLCDALDTGNSLCRLGTASVWAARVVL